MITACPEEVVLPSILHRPGQLEAEVLVERWRSLLAQALLLRIRGWFSSNPEWSRPFVIQFACLNPAEPGFIMPLVHLPPTPDDPDMPVLDLELVTLPLFQARHLPPPTQDRARLEALSQDLQVLLYPSIVGTALDLSYRLGETFWARRSLDGVLASVCARRLALPVPGSEFLSRARPAAPAQEVPCSLPPLLHSSRQISWTLAQQRVDLLLAQDIALQVKAWSLQHSDASLDFAIDSVPFRAPPSSSAREVAPPQVRHQPLSVQPPTEVQAAALAQIDRALNPGWLHHFPRVGTFVRNVVEFMNAAAWAPAAIDAAIGQALPDQSERIPFQAALRQYEHESALTRAIAQPAEESSGRRRV